MTTIRNLLLVCAGGALGTGARHLATGALAPSPSGLPVGVLLVNVSGCFAIALVLELAAATGLVSERLRLFLTTGVLGGYTTYSSFDVDVVRLAHGGAAGIAAAYLAATVAGGLAAGLLGIAAARALAGRVRGRRSDVGPAARR